ncbi:MAG TPA: endo-1,4-beta-xylanase [Sedimentisphaerales bacterium]|nr:endo-1,4-beta-xylanase [Sedimentisphaerales bacterium]
MRFQVFRNGRVIDQFTLCGAYLFGGDGLGIRRAQITFRDGFVECTKPNLETAGLALLWPIDGFGSVLLPTTCLPDRERPYNLNVEIARAKLMQIVNKREDWLFFNNIEGLTDLLKESQDLFVQAIQNIASPLEAAKLADESLEKAVVFSEKLAIKQAESLFKTRTRSHGFGRGCFGCRANPAQIGNPEYVEKLLQLFGLVTIPVNWAEVEPRKGTYDFSRIDACVDALAGKKVTLTAGPLLCFSKEYLPGWLLRNAAGFEKIRETAYHFILNVVERYSGVIRAWHVISGLNAQNHFGFGFEQILEMTRAANMAVKQASDRAVKIIEVCNPWGEYYTTTPNSIPPLVYMDMVVQSGINFDAFALQMQFGKNQSGMHVRDMMQISAILDTFGPIAKPLYVTDVEVPSRNGDDLQDGNVAGIWHEPWNQAIQGQWIEQFYRIALSKPFVSAVTYSNLQDVDDRVLAHSGLLTAELEPKESFRVLRRLHDSIFSR